ncbi:MAG: twin-arginine translocase TatA/TatE family subunit [Actinobacteria bacterium]|nr:twin-arginine translocase TatA/TatE family subunit [Actinomycetota bacterium]
MLGIGAFELVTIMIIVLIVLGPDRTPGAFRALGRWLRQLRNLTRQMREDFAEEFRFLQEEVDVLRREAQEARAELLEIRKDLTSTLQESADEITSIGSEVYDNLKPGLPDTLTGRAGPEPDAGTNGHTASEGPALPAEPLQAADAMALAIRETFGPNGATESAAAAAEPAVPGAPTKLERLTAYAPDLGEPVAPAAPTPSLAVQAAEVASRAPDPALAAIASSGVGAAPEPTLHNQLGGFLRLMIMQALEKDDGLFRAQAEDALRAQARQDSVRAKEIENWTLRDIAEVWARQRRQLVPHGAVTVDQKAEQSAVIELFECPYRLAVGQAHPICPVSNQYDIEYFKQFNAQAMYVTRMSDGASSCQLIVVDKNRLRGFGVKVDDDGTTHVDGSRPAEAAPVAGPPPVSDAAA